MTKLVATTERARRRFGEKPFTMKSKSQEKLLRALAWVEDATAKAASHSDADERHIETREMKADGEAPKKKRGRPPKVREERDYERRDMKAED